MPNLTFSQAEGLCVVGVLLFALGCAFFCLCVRRATNNWHADNFPRTDENRPWYVRLYHWAHQVEP
jgi:hypothetical protein